MTVVVLALIAAFAGGRSAAVLLSRFSGRKRRRRGTTASEDLLLAELTALGLSAGLSFKAAIEAAAAHLSDEAGARVRRSLRNPAGAGEPNEASALFAIADRALVTGAPLLASIDGHAGNIRHSRRAEATERARRLPVKLLFPLALLILPGFLLLSLGPALLAGLGRLGL